MRVTKRIREPDVTAAASRVSVHPGIRQWMVAMQRQLGASSGIVMEGRDIGTKVFPDAEVKIFLDARRGSARPAPLPTDWAPRARRPSNRSSKNCANATGAIAPVAESPLQPAADAVIIDSTNLSLDEVVAKVEAIIEQRLAAR